MGLQDSGFLSTLRSQLKSNKYVKGVSISEGQSLPQKRVFFSQDVKSTNFNITKSQSGPDNHI